jgi:pimeloyl-ACP methyl ester carboxylesterase
VAVLAVLMGACVSSGEGTTTTSEPAAETTTTTEPAPDTTMPPEPDSAARFEETDCRFEPPPEFTPRCGDLVVPENRDAPDGAVVRLHVAIFSSESPNPAQDPVIYLEGGPGGHVLDGLILSFRDRFAPLLENRDLVVFDQRGAGWSTPSLACDEVRQVEIDLLDEALPEAESGARTSEALMECRDRLVAEGVDLAAYNSASNAADVADLRSALGYDEVNLWGISYGTRLALTVMRDHPAGIRSVVLDSTVPPQLDLLSAIPASADRAFDVLFASCAEDPRCSEEYPDLEADFLELAETLDGEPAEITVANLLTREEYPGVVDRDGLYSLMFQSLYAEDVIALLPDVVTSAAGGDYGGLERLASVHFTNDEFFTLGMYLSVQCREEYPFSSIGDVEAAVAQHPDVADLFGNVAGEFDDCQQWGSGTADPIENEPVTSDIPTLILAGEFDPITPPAYGLTAAETLTNSTFFEFPGLAHGVSTATECSTAILLDFLDDPSTRPNDACIADLDGPSFYVAGDVMVTLVDFEVDLFGTRLEGVRPEEWDDQGFGAFVAPGFGDVGIVQQALPAGFATPDGIADIYQTQFELTESWTTSTFDDGSRMWSLYRSTDGDVDFDLAVVEDGEALIAILLIATPEVRDTYVTTVFEPALRAARVG